VEAMRSLGDIAGAKGSWRAYGTLVVY